MAGGTICADNAQDQALLTTLTAQGRVGHAWCPGPGRRPIRMATSGRWPGLFHGYDVPDVPRTNNGARAG